MKIEFPLMSIISVAFLAIFLSLGGSLELDSLEIGFSVDSLGMTFTVDPAFVVWSDFMVTDNAAGETFGNVSLVLRRYQGTDAGNWIKRFETNHIIQYRALGWWHYPAKLFLAIDPKYYVPQHLDDPSEADRVEWLPPDNWDDLWHFLSLKMPR